MKTVASLEDAKQIKSAVHFQMISEKEINVYEKDDVLPPELSVKPVVERIVSVSDFRSRFDFTETDAILDMAYGGDKIARHVLLKLQTADAGVNLDSADVVHGLDYLVAKNILSPKRKEAILK